MLTRLTRLIASHPALYDAIQVAAGSRTCYSRLRTMLPPTARKKVLDVGGGTGISRSSLDVTAEYIVLDVDAAKLTLLRHKHESAVSVLADAGLLPIQSGAIDIALLVFVCHHLDDATLDAALAELARVCSGTVVVMDPIWSPRRLRGRILWRYDVGRYPRTVAQLDTAIRRHLAVVAEESFAVHHEYHIWRCE